MTDIHTKEINQIVTDKKVKQECNNQLTKSDENNLSYNNENTQHNGTNEDSDKDDEGTTPIVSAQVLMIFSLKAKSDLEIQHADTLRNKHVINYRKLHIYGETQLHQIQLQRIKKY